MRRTRLLLLAPALTLVVAAGCGSNNGNSSSSSSNSSSGSATDAQMAQASTLTKAAADRVVRATRDKNLPGGKRYLTVCLQRGDPEAGNVPPNAIKCHVEAFYKDFKGRQGGYIWSEDWLIPIQNGKLGNAVILGEYRIQNFLREDNKRNCTGRHQPRQCLPQSQGGILKG